jgi:hypothetical protein
MQKLITFRNLKTYKFKKSKKFKELQGFEVVLYKCGVRLTAELDLVRVGEWVGELEGGPDFRDCLAQSKKKRQRNPRGRNKETGNRENDGKKVVA